jgi:hypothetical protein
MAKVEDVAYKRSQRVFWGQKCRRIEKSYASSAFTGRWAEPSFDSSSFLYLTALTFQRSEDTVWSRTGVATPGGVHFVRSVSQ